MSNLQSNIPHPDAAPTLDPKEPNKRFAELKKKAESFRLGIIGVANTSKTTILKKIRNTTNSPVSTAETIKSVQSNVQQPDITPILDTKEVGECYAKLEAKASSPQLNVPRPNAAPVLILNIKRADRRYAELKEKAGRFRIVIVGRANAGKTTILQKICNTTEDPEIYNGVNQKIDTANLKPTALRGYHTLENEMVFRSNPTLIFHDSPGFEAGGADEFRKVKAFVAKRAKEKSLKDQVHVIWFCIAMDDDRPITYAENQFFSESGTGKVPVVVIFTKCEALEIKAIAALEEDGYDFDEAVEKAPLYVEKKFKRVHEELGKFKYPPKGHIYFQELNKPERDCQDLVECTINVLDSNTLQGLFISTQENHLELAMKFSLRNGLKEALLFKEAISAELRAQMFHTVLNFFPYHYDDDDRASSHGFSGSVGPSDP